VTESTDAPHPAGSDVSARMRALVSRLAPEPPAGEVEGALELIQDLGYHSLALLELAFALEGEFGLPPIGERDARGMRTVADVEAYVARELDARGGG
jgi:acyl carrier protein